MRSPSTCSCCKRWVPHLAGSPEQHTDAVQITQAVPTAAQPAVSGRSSARLTTGASLRVPWRCGCCCSAQLTHPPCVPCPSQVRARGEVSFNIDGHHMYTFDRTLYNWAVSYPIETGEAVVGCGGGRQRRRDCMLVHVLQLHTAGGM